MNYPAPVRLVRRNPAPEEKRGRSRRVAEDMLKCTHRLPDADFYCWRFKIWYNTLDCAYRTKHRTYDGCADCSQGNFNLRMRARELQASRYLGNSKP